MNATERIREIAERHAETAAQEIWHLTTGEGSVIEDEMDRAEVRTIAAIISRHDESALTELEGLVRQECAGIAKHYQAGGGDGYNCDLETGTCGEAIAAAILKEEE